MGDEREREKAGKERRDICCVQICLALWLGRVTICMRWMGLGRGLWLGWDGMEGWVCGPGGGEGWNEGGWME